ncbi:MAG TPA: hypothetical protein VFS88_03295 [Micavibrio sp.]|nr:hypothetical protein [Micavibrio sp.]
MPTVISFRAYFDANAKKGQNPPLRQLFSKTEIRALDDLIFPHYERGLITDWQYGKGHDNSYLSAVDSQTGNCNQIFCVIKEQRKDDFVLYRLNIPRLRIIEQTVNFDEVRRILKSSLPNVPSAANPRLAQQFRPV